MTAVLQYILTSAQSFASQDRVLSTGGGGGGSPKSFPEKKLKAISNTDLIDDDIKESVKVTIVQKCDFSQS